MVRFLESRTTDGIPSYLSGRTRTDQASCAVALKAGENSLPRVTPSDGCPLLTAACGYASASFGLQVTKWYTTMRLNTTKPIAFTTVMREASRSSPILIQRIPVVQRGIQQAHTQGSADINVMAWKPSQGGEQMQQTSQRWKRGHTHPRNTNWATVGLKAAREIVASK